MRPIKAGDRVVFVELDDLALADIATVISTDVQNATPMVKVRFDTPGITTGRSEFWFLADALARVLVE